MKRTRLLLAAVLMFAAPAFAEGIGTQEALHRYNEGVELYKQKKFAEARVKFAEACAAYPTARCTKNLAAAEIEVGMYPEAATHFREYFASADATADPARAEAERSFARAKAAAGELEIIAPAGASIRIDDKLDVGNAPLKHTVFVAPGHHEVFAMWRDGGKVAPVDVQAGKLEHVEIRDPRHVDPLPSASASTTGTAPRPGVPPTISPSRIIVPVVLGAVAVTGLAIGTAFAVVSQGRKDDSISAAAGHPCASRNAVTCTDFQDQLDSISTARTVSIIGYTVGGVFAAASLATFLFWPKAAPVKPVVGLNSVGAEASFQF